MVPVWKKTFVLSGGFDHITPFGYGQRQWFFAVNIIAGFNGLDGQYAMPVGGGE